MDVLTFAVIVLWVVVIALIVALFAMARQIGAITTSQSTITAKVTTSI